MPRIVWPEQPKRVSEACDRQGIPLPGSLGDFLALPAPPRLTAQAARAFLRCFYAARDLERAERDLRGGGPQTESFAARAMGRRVAELRRHLEALAAALPPGA